MVRGFLSVQLEYKAGCCGSVSKRSLASWAWCYRLISTSVNGTGWISVGCVTHFSALQVSVVHCRPTSQSTVLLSISPSLPVINVIQDCIPMSIKNIIRYSPGMCFSFTQTAMTKELRWLAEFQNLAHWSMVEIENVKCTPQNISYQWWLLTVIFDSMVQRINMLHARFLQWWYLIHIYKELPRQGFILAAGPMITAQSGLQGC